MAQRFDTPTRFNSGASTPQQPAVSPTPANFSPQMWSGVNPTGATYPASNSPAPPAPATTGRQQFSNSFAPTPVAPSTMSPQNYAQTQTAINGYSGPPSATNAPGVAPVATAGGDVMPQYAYSTMKNNGIMNSNLDYIYRERYANWELNGKKGPAPTPPQFTDVDYNNQLNYANGNHEGFNLAPYQQSEYAGVLTPFNSGNTNFTGDMANKVPQVALNPWNSQIMPSKMTGSQHAPSGQVFDISSMLGPDGRPRQISGNPNAGGTAVPAGQAGTGQGQAAGQSGGGNASAVLQMLALLLGGQGQGQPRAASPFFNNNRSLFYPNTGGSQSTAAPSGTNGGPNSNVVMQLLAALLGQ